MRFNLSSLFRRKPLDPINNPFAKATTPDDIIVAAIVQSIARDFDDWEYSPAPLSRNSSWKEKWTEKCSSVNFYIANRVLHHKEKDLTISYKSNNELYEDREYFDYVYVNNISVPTAIGRQIGETYKKIKKERDELKRKADAALAEMKRNEQAWNLAENLLGMKRNEFGALVPVQTAE